MKFKADRSKLSEAVSGAAKACAVKTALTCLDGVLLSLKGDNLTITGYDLEMGIKIVMKVDGETDGDIIIDARLFGDIIRRMPNDAPVEITVKEEKNITIKSGKIKFEIQGTSSSNFPSIIDLNENISFNVNEKLLKSMISQICHAIAQTDINPILMGALFEIENGVLNMVSSDGARLALRREKIDFKDISFIVPEKTIIELNRNLCEEDDESVKIIIDRNQICFIKEDYVIFSRLIDGKFLEYRRIIDYAPERTAIMNVREVVGSLERCTLLITEKFKSPVICSFKNYSGGEAIMHLSCKTNLGEIDEDIAVKFEQQSNENQTDENTSFFTIAFNPRFMIDSLKNSGCDEVKVLFATELKPIKILPVNGEVDDDGFLFVVVPVRQRS